MPESTGEIPKQEMEKPFEDRPAPQEELIDPGQEISYRLRSFTPEELKEFDERAKKLKDDPTHAELRRILSDPTSTPQQDRDASKELSDMAQGKTKDRVVIPQKMSVIGRVTSKIHNIAKRLRLLPPPR